MSELPSMSLSFACTHSSFIEAAALCQPLAIGSDPQGNRSELSIIRTSIAVYIFHFQPTPCSGRLYYRVYGSSGELHESSGESVLVQSFSAPSKE